MKRSWKLGVLVVILSSSIITTKSEPQVPCYFVFGDSLSDVGNNNNLNTKAKANYPPYGVDFPGGVATGRFSNGRNFVDRIAELLGFDEYIPPYSTASGREILKGVNYASGAAGIRSETGQHLGERISMDQQLANHIITVAKMAWLVGPIEASRRLSKCLYTVNIGNNDFINNYFMPEKYPSSKQFTPAQYADALAKDLSRQLKTLYLTGARKVAVFGAGQIGCTLGQIFIHGTNGSLCVDNINQAVQLFNDKLVSLVDQFNSHFLGSQFTYIGSGPSIQCKEDSTPCLDRMNYIFWDGYHPTELVNIATAEAAYNAEITGNVYPVGIKTLVSLDQGLIANPITKTGYYPSPYLF